jgi:molecular chaperone GrpE (heat shock protein)
MAEELTKYLRNLKKNKTDKEYIELLETIAAELAQAVFESKISDGVKIQELLEHSAKVAEHLPRLRWGFEKITALAEKAIQRAEKYSGKKVSKKRQAIYDEIEKVHKGLQSQGAQGAYTEATRIVAKKHKQNSEKLYRSFIKYKNTLYVKSPKRRKA